MILEILLPLPTNKTFFYKNKEKSNFNPKVGTLVEVEFRGKLKIGIIWKIKTKVDFKKPIKNIKEIYRDFFFNDEILTSIQFISSYSCNSKAMLLKFFLSNFSKKILPSEDIPNETNYNKVTKLQLNDEQKIAIKKLKKHSFQKYNVVVLDGVTGSGKTRVYMHKVLEVMKSGLQCLILVPEIILTGQWVKEIQMDFGAKPYIYHSSIKKKDRETIWHGVAKNKINLVIGTRSSLFLPFKKLGIIVVDEEHDVSYKQEENIVLNFRDFSVVRAKNSSCLLLLVSATPSIETLYNCMSGKYKKIELKKRVNNSILPIISTIDMKKEKKDVLISKKLEDTICSNLKKNYQTLIFINKRGYAPFVICRKCGFVIVCKNCNTSMVIHEYIKDSNSFLLCHHCNEKKKFTNSCLNCSHENSFTFHGLGIEKIFENLSNSFPKAKISMLSSDQIKNSQKLDLAIQDIVKNKINIIVGTQLISKGHNFPFLKTVGIINIDSLLSDFDFRSTERTFQQITQVSGRAGRKSLDGEVYIQTFQPNHPILEMSKKYDKKQFLNWEILSRKKNFQPPFSNLISICIESTYNLKAKNIIESICKIIKDNYKKLEIYGPAPAIIFKKKKRFRYRLLIKIEKNFVIQKNLKDFISKIVIPKNAKLYIDVDPYSFL
ncbi:MAG: primosomal protein N' [Pseudomonadota bacterium]|nr:primosomal protein N' [Pseudomonadota bacterium]